MFAQKLEAISDLEPPPIAVLPPGEYNTNLVIIVPRVSPAPCQKMSSRKFPDTDPQSGTLDPGPTPDQHQNRAHGVVLGPLFAPKHPENFVKNPLITFRVTDRQTDGRTNPDHNFLLRRRSM